MTGTVRESLQAFDTRGAFSEDDYAALKSALLGVGRVPQPALDGFIGLFFERHVLDDVRRRELLAMDDEGMLRALKHRFRQVVAGSADDHQAWHALSAHVREALESLLGPGGRFPASIQSGNNFSSIAVEQAVAAFWLETGHKPTSREATAELVTRYLKDLAPPEGTKEREFPEIMRAQLDAQRLARGILEVLSDEERDLFRAQIDGVRVEDWAKPRGVSRATAYRMLARIKSLCRLEFDERSRRTLSTCSMRCAQSSDGCSRLNGSTRAGAQ